MRPLNARKPRPAAASRPTVLDLFSGCGGMTLGFVLAGFRSVGGVELDPHAARSHALNFHADSPRLHAHAQARDILKTAPHALLDELGEAGLELDCLVGGPPCVTFTRIGRAKLREVLDHPLAYRIDPRSMLYERYLAYVQALRPRSLVMENVPDILNQDGQNLGDAIAMHLAELGYVARYTLLNAAHYGVPQSRDRFFLIALRDDLGLAPRFPAATHEYALPAGYHGGRQVALKHVVRQARLPSIAEDELESFFVEPPAPLGPLQPAITAREAIGDLPRLAMRSRGARSMDTSIDYDTGVEVGTYAHQMRSQRGWPGQSDIRGLTAHETRSLGPRDQRIFAEMRPGDEYPQAHALALELLEREVRRRGGRSALSDEEFGSLTADYVPPYAAGKFPNKWRKMEADSPARTLMAHLGKDSYTHIHYDSAQARVISVREAARLQSFPDSFVFSGTMNPAFRQVGNAVPPILARVIAGIVREDLRAAAEPQLTIGIAV